MLGKAEPGVPNLDSGSIRICRVCANFPGSWICYYSGVMLRPSPRTNCQLPPELAVNERALLNSAENRGKSMHCVFLCICQESNSLFRSSTVIYQTIMCLSFQPPPASQLHNRSKSEPACELYNNVPALIRRWL